MGSRGLRHCRVVAVPADPRTANEGIAPFHGLAVARQARGAARRCLVASADYFDRPRHRDARNRLLTQTAALLAARGDQLAGDLDAVNDTYLHAAERFAHLPNVLQLSIAPANAAAADFDSLRELLKVMPASDRNVIAVAILDPAGVVKAASDVRLIGVDLAYRSFVQEALEGCVGDLRRSFRRSPARLRARGAYAAPVSAAGKGVIGLAVVWIRAAALWDVMKASNGLAGPGSFAVLLDSLGIRIAHSYSNGHCLSPRREAGRRGDGRARRAAAIRRADARTLGRCPAVCGAVPALHGAGLRWRGV